MSRSQARPATPKHTGPPVYRQKRTQGRDMAFIVLSGERIYLGAYDAPDMQVRYNQEVSAWYARGKMPRNEGAVCDPVQDAAVTVRDCADRFLEYCRDYYATSPQTSYDRIAHAMNDLCALWGNAPVADLTGLHIRAVREAMVNRRRKTNPEQPALNVSTVNFRIKTIKRMIAYCVSLNLCPPEVRLKVDSVENLIAGRCAAPPPKKVTPVPDADIDAIRPYLNASLRALVDLQLACGARPGELVGLRRRDVVMVDDDLWEVSLSQHKTAWRDRRRVIMFGPASIEVLRPLVMRRKQDECLFPAAESMVPRIEGAHCHRRENQKPNERKTARTLGECYTTASYRRAIHRLCAEHDIPQWSPNQLRHNFATKVRRMASLEAARLLLGHADRETSEIYAEKDLGAARELARRLG